MTTKKTVAETILDAIKHEIEGREFYLALAGKVKNPLIRRKILGLADDEMEHRETLSRLYWAQTGTDPGDLTVYEVNVQLPDMENLTLEELLEMAMNTEKQASETYLQMAEAAQDPRTSAFLEYLAEFETGHFETLSGELKKIRKAPDWADQGPSD